MSTDTEWAIYRDESRRDLLTKVRGCLAEFERKTGMKSNVVGVASSLKEEERRTLEAQGLRVVQNLPAWAKNEIWIGHDQ